MKQNMKRMLLVLCMAVCFFALSACGSASEEAVEPISPEIEQTMSDGAKSYLEQFASYSDEDLAAQLKQAEKQKNTVIESAISSWTSSKDDLGKMGEIQSVTVERADDDSYTAVVQASFEKRDLTFSLTAEESVSSYGGTSLVPTELSFVVNYSFGEKMEKAALNTLMKRAARRVAGAVWKGKKPLVDSVTSKRKQFEAETKALEDTEITETGGPQEKTDSDAEAREKHRRKLRLLGKVRERRKDRKRKMTEKREAGSHEEDH